MVKGPTKLDFQKPFAKKRSKMSTETQFVLKESFLREPVLIYVSLKPCTGKPTTYLRTNIVSKSAEIARFRVSLTEKKSKN